MIDLCLPDMEGTELFPLIQNTSPNTLKIMLTGKTLVQGSIEGADALLGKPIAPDKLLSIIDGRLKNRNDWKLISLIGRVRKEYSFLVVAIW